jgi:hypothetical protein
MRKVIDSQSKKLQEHVSNQQYLVFRPFTEVDLAKVDKVRNSIGKHTRMTHYTDTNLLIVKLMPSATHESAHLSLSTGLIVRMIRMGMSEFDLRPLGGTRFPGRMSSKEGDSSHKPSSRTKENDWPTIVFESGLSESLQGLRCDAKWWLENSEREVNIVVIISIKPAERKLYIEKWELALQDGRRPAPRLHPGTQTLIPTPLQEITVTANNSVTGAAPLVLEFEKIFLRPAVPPEDDIRFTAADLLRWAEAFWAGLQ